MTSASVPLPGRPRPREESPPALKRVISRNMLLLFVIGDMLGAGIYALVGEVGGRVGGAIWTSFLLAAVLAAFTAGAYAELIRGARDRRDPVDHDHFRMPTWIPIGGFVISFAAMTTKDLDIFARAGVLLVVGAALYGLNVLLTGPRGPFQTEELEALKG